MTDAGELLAFINARLGDDETRLDQLDDPQEFPKAIYYQEKDDTVVIEPWGGKKAYVHLRWDGQEAPDWRWVIADDAVPLLTPATIARGRAEVAAKRAIMDLHVPVTLYAGHPLVRPVPGATRLVCRSCEPPAGSADAVPCPTMLALTLAYRDHPDWREEWAA